MADSSGALRPEFEGGGQPIRSSSDTRKTHRERQAALPAEAGRHRARRASARAQGAAGAALVFDAAGRDLADLEQASAELWAALFIDEAARGVLRRDGLDPARLPLSGPHPFAYAPAEDGALTRVSVEGVERAAADSLLDLFRVYFLRRLSA